MRKIKGLCTLGIVGVLALLIAVNASAADAALDFSKDQNPHKDWTYGYKKKIGGALIKYKDKTDKWYGNPKVVGWVVKTQGVAGEPVVLKNISNKNQQAGGMNLEAWQLGMHPGPKGEYSVVRWTAPSAGRYSIDGSFEALDTEVGTTTDVYVLHNNKQIWTISISGKKSAESKANFELAVEKVEKGDTIDFAVGYGSNRNYYYDSTALKAAISK